MSINFSGFVDQKIRTAWVKSWALDFLKGLDAITGRQAIESYCQAQKADFELKCQELSSKRQQSEERETTGVGWKNSTATHMSQIRSAIKAWQQYKAEKNQLIESDTYPQTTKEGTIQQHYSLLVMNYPSNFHKERMEPTNQKKQEQRSNLEPINCVDEYQNTIDKLLASTDHRELTAGLIAASGRRPSEILKTAQFEQVGKFEVNFSGQLKAKNEIRDSYSTYTLIESQKVIDGLARLRRMPEIKSLKRETLAEIDSGRNNKINSKVREFFSPLINPPSGENQLSAKNLRASYAAIAIYLFCPWKKSTNQFITERLGHVSDATATNYEDYQVCDKEGKPLTRGAWVEKINEDMETPMEANIVNTRIRITESAKNALDNQEFLPFADTASRMEELVRLAKIGKKFEKGELVKEVVIVKSSPDREEKMEETTQVLEVREVTEVKATPAKSKVRELSELSNQELFGSNRPFSTEEKIRRAVEAVKTHNERQAEKQYWWAINTKVLTDLTGCRSAAIKKYMESPEGRLNITDYNLQHGLGYQHNKGKGSVTDFIKLD